MPCHCILAKREKEHQKWFINSARSRQHDASDLIYNKFLFLCAPPSNSNVCVKTQLSSPPKAYRRKKPDTGQQRAEKLFTRWVKGEFELTESTPQEDIKMLLQYVGVKPAITVGKRVHLAQLIEAFSQLPLLRPTESKELLWVKNKVMAGYCYRNS